jgi:hypothetical protein
MIATHLLNLLEPGVRLDRFTLDELIPLSTAISLKRIADSLENITTTLEEQLICSNSKKSLAPSGEKC